MLDNATQNAVDATIQEINDAMKAIQESQTVEEQAAIQEVVTNEVIADIREDALLAPESDGTTDAEGNPLQQLGQKPTTNIGDFVFDLQGNYGTGTDARFRHVHKDWTLTGCLPFDKAIEYADAMKDQVDDLIEPLAAFLPVVVEQGGKSKVALRHRATGRDYFPTDSAYKNLAVTGFTFEGFLKDVNKDKLHPTKRDDEGEPVVLFERDQLDADLLRRVLTHTTFRPDRVDQDKKRLFRTWKNGTLRAVLSEGYKIIDNRWILTVLKELIPGGLVSHFRVDGDSIVGNVLIPDTLRQESDSQYGGMETFCNSEIGLRSIFTCPSVFRSICMNGCIWDQEKGSGVKQKHYGNVDLDALKTKIAQNLQVQIPLLTGMIEQLLATRGWKVLDTVAMKKVVAEVGHSFKMTRKQTDGVLQAWHVEQNFLGVQEARSAFGVINAVTRFAQSSPEITQHFDQIGGEIGNLGETKWNALVERAGAMDDDDVAKAYPKSING